MCENAEETTELLPGEERSTTFDDLSEWMKNLPAHVTLLPLNQISIPGSHDSGAFSLDPNSPLCPGESPAIKTLCNIFGTCAKKVVMKWSITQQLLINDQLHHGIRYFDMRNGYLQADDDIFFVHGLYGHLISELLEAINVFLDQHPKEVVVVDFNHFYSFTPSIHLRFAKSILSVFGDKVLPPTSKLAKCTLAEIWEAKKQVILIYDDATICKSYSQLWSSDSVFSPWPNTDSTSKLINSLDKRFDSIKPNCFNVFQAILTPQTSTIVKAPFSSLKNKLCIKCDTAVAAWLTKIYTSKQRGVNILIFDFAGLSNCSGDIIRLNELLRTKCCSK